MQYSNPSLMVSGESPFHHPGTPRTGRTESAPGTTVVNLTEPFSPVTSHLPKSGAANAVTVTALNANATVARLSQAADAFTRLLLSCVIVLSPRLWNEVP